MTLEFEHAKQAQSPRKKAWFQAGSAPGSLFSAGVLFLLNSTFFAGIFAAVFAAVFAAMPVLIPAAPGFGFIPPLALHAQQPQQKTAYAESENDFLFIRLSTLSWDSAALSNSFKMDSPFLYSNLAAGRDTVRLAGDPEGLSGSEITVGYRWDEFPGHFAHMFSVSRFDANTSKIEFAAINDSTMVLSGTDIVTNSITRTDAFSSSEIERTAVRYHGDYHIFKDIKSLKKFTGPAAPYVENLGFRAGADVIYETVTHRGVRIEPITLTSTASSVTNPTSATDARQLTHTYKENKWNAFLGLSYSHTFFEKFTLDLAASRVYGFGSGRSSFKLVGPYSLSRTSGLDTLPFVDLEQSRKFDVETRGDIKEAGLTIHLFGPVSFRVGYEAQSITYFLKKFSGPEGPVLPRMTTVNLLAFVLASGGAEGINPESRDISKRLTFELQYRLR